MTFPRVTSLLFRIPAPLRSLLFARHASSSTSNITSHLPRIAQPALWKSLLPRRDPSFLKPSDQGGFWKGFWANPASSVIILAMLTGNCSIHLIRLKRDMNTYTRKADQKIELLREVIKRVQSGEVFDVEKALGTGDPQMEEEWFDVIKEIENDEKIVSRGERQRLRRAERAKEKAEKEAKQQGVVEGNGSEKPEFL